MRQWLAALAGMVAATAGGQSLYSVPAESARPPSSPAARSVLFDAPAAQRERARQQPAYVESIFVEGYDPDAPRRRKPLEQRFADALLAPPAASATGLRGLNATQCMSVISSWNNFGNSYAPLTGCPGGYVEAAPDPR
jgi:hypothetical protein